MSKKLLNEIFTDTRAISKIKIGCQCPKPTSLKFELGGRSPANFDISYFTFDFAISFHNFKLWS